MEGQENVNTGMKIENIKNTKENPKMKLEDKIGLLQQQIRYYIGIIRRQNRIVRELMRWIKEERRIARKLKKE